MLDRYTVIRVFLYKLDENGELFFGIPQFDGVIAVFLISTAEELYDYLLEQAVAQLIEFAVSIIQ